MDVTILALVLSIASPVQAGADADHHAEPCPATSAPLPAGLEGWSRMMPLKAAANASKAAVLPIGTSVKAALLPVAAVTYPMTPGKPAVSTSSGGLFAVTVPAAARYRVALGAGAWVDIVRDGKPVTSIAHVHGPACSGVRKMVDFDLVPGRYVLQISGNATAEMGVMVARSQ